MENEFIIESILIILNIAILGYIFLMHKRKNQLMSPIGIAIIALSFSIPETITKDFIFRTIIMLIMTVTGFLLYIIGLKKANNKKY